MRAFGSRADTIVCDEPLYAHYLAETGLDHPMAGEIIRRHESDWRAVAAWLTAPLPAGKGVFYQKHMAHQLLPGIERGWLGIELSSTPTAGMAVGLEVTRVLQRGPADQAGPRVGDLIVAIDEQPAVSSAVVSRLIAHAAPGASIELDILRGEQAITVTARSGERPVPN
jgi:predicted metalloprotease with PDZ domain